MRLQGDDWSRKIPVDAKVLLMQLLNIESKVCKGEQNNDVAPEKLNNNPNVSLRELFEQKPNLGGRRTEVIIPSYYIYFKVIFFRCVMNPTGWLDLKNSRKSPIEEL